MKKLLLSFLLMMGLPAMAADYSYLTFETTEGAKASVSVEGLSMTFSGNTLRVGDLTFEVSNLSRMYFSDSDVSTGVEKISLEDAADDAEVYDLNGHRLKKEQMGKGVYLVKDKSRTYKIVIR